ncbi:MAG: hypothetical protein M3R67_05935 [Acidobacteriota bacterium]|nr:hypothetical protein [Acidobacteriota bacterium]
MKTTILTVCFAGAALIVGGASIFSQAETAADTAGSEVSAPAERVVANQAFDVQVLVDGRPLAEYYSRGKSYVEAIEGAEYGVRIRNPLPFRVAVALSVDGMNTIDARRTTAWNASKWVIEPYGTIDVTGWQMSSERARRFYFTSERDSYGAKLGQTSNLGVIAAVFFRERRPIVVPVTPPPRPRPPYEEDRGRENKSSGAGARTEDSTVRRQGQIAPVPDDDYAATGIGRSVRNDVSWINLDLESRPTAEVMIRYEYYPALVRLGILPRNYSRPDHLRRREESTGFVDRRFSPEP